MSADQFYVMAEDGITKLAGPFESEDAAVAEIEKIANEVAAETSKSNKNGDGSAEALRNSIQTKLTETYGGGAAISSSGLYITETYPDYVIVSSGSGYQKIPYTIDAEGDVQLGQPTKVEQTWSAKAAEPKPAELKAEPALAKVAGPKSTWKSTTFGDRFWALVKDAVQLPSWGTVNAPGTGGDVVRQSSDAADRSTDDPSSGSHIVIQVAPAAENQAAGLTAVDGAEVADGSDLVQKYAIAKSVEPQRYTLGVAYPANRVDVHGDFMDAADLEKAAWAFLAKADAGVMHQKGTGGAGQVVESYIHRGPTYKSEGGDEVRPGDWMLGVVWGQPTWDRIAKGELKGFSFQGFAKRSKSKLA